MDETFQGSLTGNTANHNNNQTVAIGSNAFLTTNHDNTIVNALFATPETVMDPS